MSNTISNREDILDSRDIIERLEELEEAREALVTAMDDAEIEEDEDAYALSKADFADWVEDHEHELHALRRLNAEGSDYAPDWEYGETLIRDSYFENYAQELAEDTGAINRDASWPNNCIDWERAAEELQMDYSSIDFDGVTYWVRS